MVGDGLGVGDRRAARFDPLDDFAKPAAWPALATAGSAIGAAATALSMMFYITLSHWRYCGAHKIIIANRIGISKYVFWRGLAHGYAFWLAYPLRPRGGEIIIGKRRGRQ
jgi:hypothetical protein